VGEALGTPADDESLWPHVTLVRLRRPARVTDAVGPALDDAAELAFDVSRASLYDSETVPGGRRYLPLASVELVAPAGAAPTTT
jgi:2'-5' RNA ligase